MHLRTLLDLTTLYQPWASFYSQPMTLVAVLHMFNLQTRMLAFSCRWKACPVNISEAPQPPTSPSCPEQNGTALIVAVLWSLPASLGSLLKPLHFCGAGTRAWNTSLRETGCAWLPVSICLHPSAVILGNSPHSRSGFICTALVNSDGFEPTGTSLCCSNILNKRRWQMESTLFIYFRYFQFPLRR